MKYVDVCVAAFVAFGVLAFAVLRGGTRKGGGVR
jgi:hypothetical protein